ncbi:MAG: hypothetical protein K2Y02_06845 [Burkholderiaceae bacterium]|nr:hypothetical protein [Burkholderiaceae bacterium]
MRSSSDLKVGALDDRPHGIALHARSAGPSLLGLRVGALLAAVGLVGCAAVSEPRYAVKDGWRAARIDTTGPASNLRQVTSEDCRSSATPSQRAADRFAVVSYWSLVPSRRYPSGWFPRIVPLEATATLNAGDAVYVNILDCAAPVVARDDRR